MKVTRIVANLFTQDPAKAEAFYRDILGLDLAMDHRWIRTYTSAATMPVQVSFASQGGSDTPVPDLSIEVDDLAQALHRMQAAGIAHACRIIVISMRQRRRPPIAPHRYDCMAPNPESAVNR